jgi:hypothetical protein
MHVPNHQPASLEDKTSGFPETSIIWITSRKILVDHQETIGQHNLWSKFEAPSSITDLKAIDKLRLNYLYVWSSWYLSPREKHISPWESMYLPYQKLVSDIRQKWLKLVIANAEGLWWFHLPSKTKVTCLLRNQGIYTAYICKHYW